MLDSYFSLLIQTINMIIGARTHLLNKKGGCKELYALYLSLDRVLKKSLDVRRELSDALQEDRHREHVYFSLEDLSKCTYNFAEQLSELQNEMEIFDPYLKEDLVKLLGWKYSLLYYVCSHSYIIKQSDKQKLLLRITVDIEKLLSLPLPQFDDAMSLFLDVVSISSESDKSRLEKQDFVNNEYIPFDDKTRIEEVLLGVDKNLEQLRLGMRGLATFIRKNCRYAELF